MRTKLVIALLVPLLACREASAPAATPPAAEPPADKPATANRELGYPNADLYEHDLSTLLLAASHIVVAHRDSKLARGLPPVTARERTRDAALARAFDLRDQLLRDPARFEAIAARESDEPATAALGGSLGVFSPYAMPEPIMNALGQLRAGELSRVVESEQGFHLLRRNAVPPNAQIALSHIVIKFTGNTGWQRQDRPLPARTRDEARALAAELAQQARGADAAAFAELARSRSDADDAMRGGDMGVWSRHDQVDTEFLLFETGFRLALDGVSGVIETPTGFHVLRRSAQLERPLLAASVIAIAYAGSQADRLQPGRVRDKAKAARIAQQLLDKLRRKPAELAARRLEYCELFYCDAAVAWRVGRGLPAFEAAVAALEVGALSPAIDSPLGWLIVRREDPAQVPLPPPEPVTFEFPSGLSPEERQALVEPTTPGAQPPAAGPSEAESDVAEVGSFEAHLRGALRVPASERNELARVFAGLRERIMANPSGDLAPDYAWADSEFRRVLDEDSYEELLRQRRVWSARQPH